VSGVRVATRLREASQGETTGWHWPMLALVRQRVGQTTEARASLAKARQWIEAKPAGKTAWIYRLPVELLRAEAEKALAEVY
jgi:hypothetical protein